MPDSTQAVGSKYAPLARHLRTTGTDRLAMSFGEIESLIGGPLPASARKYRAWWSNNPTNSVITCAWLAAGYRSAEVDMAGETLVFRKAAAATAASGFAERAASPSPTPDDLVDPQEWAARTGRKLPPIFGCMKGTLTLLPDVDYTEPADPDWGKVYDT